MQEGNGHDPMEPAIKAELVFAHAAERDFAAFNAALDALVDETVSERRRRGYAELDRNDVLALISNGIKGAIEGLIRPPTPGR